MTEHDVLQLVRHLKVLADESRLRILGILAGKDASVEELAAYLDLKPPTVSHHLNKLREVDMVSMQAEGNTHVYRFQPQMLLRLNRELLTPEKLTNLVHDVASDKWEQKVLRDFLNGDELKEIPASRKKRVVVLKWLADKFEPHRKYKESEVNETMKRHHPDFATLRRELIGNGPMDRQDGIYWRIPSSENESTS